MKLADIQPGVEYTHAETTTPSTTRGFSRVRVEAIVKGRCSRSRYGGGGIESFQPGVLSGGFHSRNERLVRITTLDVETGEPCMNIRGDTTVKEGAFAGTYVMARWLHEHWAKYTERRAQEGGILHK